MFTSLLFFFFNDTAPTDIYTLSLHDALPIFTALKANTSTSVPSTPTRGLKILTKAPTPTTPSIGLRSEEHTSELQSQSNLVCRLLLEKKNYTSTSEHTIRPRCCWSVTVFSRQ